MRLTRSALWLGVVMPIAIIVIILTADAIEGPKTAFVGVLAVVPVFGAVFGTPVSTAFVGLVTLASAYAFGLLASDGNAPAQAVRLVIIALMSALAVVAASLRQRQESRLAEAERQAERSAAMAVLAQTDQLTQIPNRLGVIERAVAMVEQGGAGERTIALLDLDNLKPVNDEHGHQIGDAYLQAVARRLASSVSSADAVGRWGGDEFLLVFAQPVAGGEQTMHRVHAALVDHPVATAGITLTVSISAGVTHWAPGEDMEAALARADHALYRAKHAGRNLVFRGEE